MAEQEKCPPAVGWAQSECEILCAPGQVHEARSGQRPLQLGRSCRPKGSLAANFDPANRFVFQKRREAAHEDFDFRQLRHPQTLAVAVGRRKRESVGQVPDLAHRAAAQQHFDDVEAQLHAGLFEQLEIIERGLRKKTAFVGVHGGGRTRPFLGRTRFDLHEHEAIAVPKDEIDFAPRRAEVGGEKF